MRTRPHLNTKFDSGVGTGPESATHSFRPSITFLPRRGERNSVLRRLLLRRPILLLYALWALASSSSSATPSSARQLPIAPTFCEQGCATADLDGDGRPDLAVAKLEGRGPGGFRYRIDLDLTSRGGPSSFSLMAQRGGLLITPRDVNGDWELDLIVTSAWSFTPVGVWINNGHGEFARNDPASGRRPSRYASSTILRGFSGEVFQATLPESSRHWPDYSQEPSFYNEILTERLTPHFCDVRLPSCCPRRSPTRGPPFWFWQPSSPANAPTV
jgi:hypothetical protein